ncbi:MAG TPA: type II secretion system protein GspE, partial [Nitrospiria bacterium]
MPRPSPLIGQILQEKFDVRPEQIEEALTHQREKGGLLGEILVHSRVVKVDQVFEALGLQFRLSSLSSLPLDQVDTALLSRVPIGFAKRYEFLPLKEENGRVSVAVGNPLNLSELDDIRLLLGRDVKPVLAPPQTVLEGINRLY